MKSLSLLTGRLLPQTLRPYHLPISPFCSSTDLASFTQQLKTHFLLRNRPGHDNTPLIAQSTSMLAHLPSDHGQSFLSLLSAKIYTQVYSNESLSTCLDYLLTHRHHMHRPLLFQALLKYVQVLAHLDPPHQIEIVQLILEQTNSPSEIIHQLDTLLYFLTSHPSLSIRPLLTHYLLQITPRTLPSANSDMVSLLQICLLIQSLSQIKIEWCDTSRLSNHSLLSVLLSRLQSGSTFEYSPLLKLIQKLPPSKIFNMPPILIKSLHVSYLKQQQSLSFQMPLPEQSLFSSFFAQHQLRVFHNQASLSILMKMAKQEQDVNILQQTLLAQISQLQLVSAHCQAQPDDSDAHIVMTMLNQLVLYIENTLFKKIDFKKQSIHFLLELLKSFSYSNRGSSAHLLRLLQYFMDKYIVAQFDAQSLCNSLLPILSYKKQKIAQQQNSQQDQQQHDLEIEQALDHLYLILLSYSSYLVKNNKAGVSAMALLAYHFQFCATSPSRSTFYSHLAHHIPLHRFSLQQTSQILFSYQSLGIQAYPMFTALLQNLVSLLPSLIPNDEHTNQCALVYVSLLNTHYYDAPLFQPLENYLIDNISLLSQHNLVSFLASFCLIPSSSSRPSLITSLLPTLLQSLSKESPNESVLIQHTLRMGYSLMLLDCFSKDAQPFWEYFMGLLYQYKSQVLLTHSYVYNLYLLYLRLFLGRDSQFIYTEQLQNCLKEVLIAQEHKLANIIRATRRTPNHDLEQQCLALLQNRQSSPKDIYVYIDDHPHEQGIGLFKSNSIYIPYQFDVKWATTVIDFQGDSNRLQEFHLTDSHDTMVYNQVLLFKQQIMYMMGYNYVKLEQDSAAPLIPS